MLLKKNIHLQISAFVQDTEFPGIVARPVCDFGAMDYQYQVSNNLKY
jgi:hypothetical protein